MLVCAGAEGLGKLSFVTCTSPIMHHVYAPKFYIIFVFHFSCVLQSSRGKLKTKFMQNFWVGGQTRCAHIVGNLQMTNKYALRAKMIDRLNRRYHGASWFKGAMSPVAHALASENKLQKDGPSFSSSVRDFGRLFLAVEISAIVR